VKSNDIIRVGKVGQRHQPVLQLEKDERYLVGLIMYILNIFVPLLQQTGNFSKRTSSFSSIASLSKEGTLLFHCNRLVPLLKEYLLHSSID
jgi:hypothetical protein